MKRISPAHAFTVCFMAFSLMGAFVTFKLPSAGAQAPPPTYAPGELLIKFKAKVPPAAVQDLFSRIQAKPLEKLNQAGWIRVRVPNQTAHQMIPHVRQFPQVQAVEPNYLVQAIGIPNDTDFSKLWGLHNTGQSGGTADADLDAPEAWDSFTAAGNTVIVAVIDSGVDHTHPDLAGRMWLNPGEVEGNGVDDDRNGYIDDKRGWDFVNNDIDPMDDNNHGTHVAGTIAAGFNNSRGIAGVAGPANVKTMPLKFLNANGSGYTSNAIKALEYATAKGAVISNNSWGGGGYSQALADSIARNYQAGRLFVAAAGNNATNTDTTPYYPQGYNIPNVISVASTTASDSLSSFSNYGAQSVDLAAPGSNIYSTIRGGYATYNGTSMAAPHVAGAAALMWAKNPALTNVQIKQILMENSRKVAYLNGKTVSGGMLNLKNAVSAAGASTKPLPASNPTPAPDPSTIPAAPSNLIAQHSLTKTKTATIRYAKLTWADNASNEGGYEVWQSTYPDRNFVRIKQLAANTTTWTHQISMSMMKSDYYYKVRAYNTSGPSGFSNTVRVVRF